MRREGRYHRVLEGHLRMQVWNHLLHATRPSPSPTGDGTGMQAQMRQQSHGTLRGPLALFRGAQHRCDLAIDPCLKPRGRSLRARSREPQPVRRHELPERTVATDEILKPLLRTYYGFEVLIVEAGASASSAGRMFWEMPTHVSHCNGPIFYLPLPCQ